MNINLLINFKQIKIILVKLYKIKNDEGKEVNNIMFFRMAIFNYPASEVSRQLNTYKLREQ